MKPMLQASLILVYACSISMSQPSQASPRPEIGLQHKNLAPSGFKRATYKSILFGKSKQADIIKIFGKPADSGPGEDGVIYLSYINAWEKPGSVSFAIHPKSKVVMSMSVIPTSKDITTITKLLGGDYIASRWEHSVCGKYDDSGSSPVYRHPNGTLTTLDYPGLGIVVAVVGGKVQSVEYLSSPFGFEMNPCDDRSRGAHGDYGQKIRR